MQKNLKLVPFGTVPGFVFPCTMPWGGTGVRLDFRTSADQYSFLQPCGCDSKPVVRDQGFHQLRGGGVAGRRLLDACP